MMDPKAFEVLVDEMEAFLRVPKISWEDWEDADEDMRAALLIATKRVELERIALISVALRGEAGLAAATKDLDGGREWVRAHIRAAIDTWVSKISKAS